MNFNEVISTFRQQWAALKLCSFYVFMNSFAVISYVFVLMHCARLHDLVLVECWDLGFELQTEHEHSFCCCLSYGSGLVIVRCVIQKILSRVWVTSQENQAATQRRNILHEGHIINENINDCYKCLNGSECSPLIVLITVPLAVEWCFMFGIFMR
jgi:hypothetical protein